MVNHLTFEDFRTIAPTASSGGGGGLVKKVQSVTKTNASTLASTTRVDIPVLSVTVTGLIATDEILITGMVSVGSSVVTQEARIHIDADGVEIGQGDAAGSRARCHANMRIADSTSPIVSIPINFLYQPATTSSVIIKLQFSGESSDTMYINRSGSDSDNDAFSRPVSTLTVMVIRE